MNYKYLILICCALVSCKTSEKVVYMQDAFDKRMKTIDVYEGIVVQPKDMLSIVVSSKDPELAQSFNLPLQTYQAGSATTSYGYSHRLLGYMVDLEGNIDFPTLGKLKVVGLTREQLADMIRQKLVRSGLILDAIVTVEFGNFKISVLGEVRSPGTFTLVDDRITILEAISRAGDLTLYGKRDNVLVRREQEGKIAFHRVDLRSKALFDSPVYYLQQNDVVYVQPNNTMIARSRINENRSLNVWISLASFLTSVTILIINLSK